MSLPQNRLKILFFYGAGWDLSPNIYVEDGRVSSPEVKKEPPPVATPRPPSVPVIAPEVVNNNVEPEIVVNDSKKEEVPNNNSARDIPVYDFSNMVVVEAPITEIDREIEEFEDGYMATGIETPRPPSAKPPSPSSSSDDESFTKIE